MSSTPMKAFVFASLTLCAASAFAQQAPDLPQPSPKAKVEQRVGLTDVAVEYSSPGVKGRPIWGTLVPYDAQWRTGANAATRFTSSRDFVFGDKPVPAGSYTLYTIPGKASWIVALNTSKEGWSGGYDVKTDVARVTVKAVPLVKPRERMAFIFSETTDDGTRLDLEWAKLRVSVPLRFDTKTQAMANIEAAVGDAWRPHFLAARYLLDNNGDLAQGVAYADASIAIKATWWNNWIRAQLLAKQGKTADAIAAAHKTQELGTGDKVYEGNFKAEVEKTLAGWQKKK